MRPRPSTARKAPALDRIRRTLLDQDAIDPSVDLARDVSELHARSHQASDEQHRLSRVGPSVTAGDIDADWQSAWDVGDEAPGGDNPTPDQDVVEEIGRAIGVSYEDAEELRGEDKVVERDRHRWERNPASSDDFPER
ncbi:MAG: hypothetical protein FJW23_17060 [Acidimicrobiia bacterium]|nr:hypothetical protein [Acidimicrobiia bacterium]